jgi:hypothetical protein
MPFVFLSRSSLFSFLSFCLLMQTLVTHAQSGQDTVWIVSSGGCKVHNPNPKKNETITWSGGCKDGYASGEGTLTWYRSGKSGSQYDGFMKRGRPHGKGKYDFGGVIEEGQYVEGKLHGPGTRTEMGKNNSVAYYFEGTYKNDETNGPGREIYFFNSGDTSSVFTGSFTEGYYKNGEGVYKTFSLGKVRTVLKGTFNGELVQGEVEQIEYDRGYKVLQYNGNYGEDGREGYGEETLGAGHYTGDWKKNMREGKGTLKAGGIVIYDGEWSKNKFNGVGIRTYPDGSYYHGEFKDNQRHGFGVMHWKNGTKYIGEFRNELYTGLGCVSVPGGLGPSGTWEGGRLATPQPWRDIKKKLQEKYSEKLLKFDPQP